MSALLFQRRRAERFAELIEETGANRRPHTRSMADADLRHLVSLTRRVSDLPLTVEAHPEFRDGLRAMLMATIEREGIGSTATPEPEPATRRHGLWSDRQPEQQRIRRRTRTIGTIAAGLAASALVLTGMSAASGVAAPGDALYGVKRQAERAQLAWAGSDVNEGKLYLKYAGTRLDEAKVVRNDPDALASVLNEMDEQTRLGVSLLTTAAMRQKDASPLDVVDAFATPQAQELGTLRNSLPANRRARADASAQLLVLVVERSAALRPLVPCGTAATSEADELGPVPSMRCSAVQPDDADSNGSTHATPQPDPTSPSPKPEPTSRQSPSPEPSKTNRATSSPTTTGPTTTPEGQLVGQITDVVPNKGH